MSIDWTQMKTAEHIETERLEQATESARGTAQIPARLGRAARGQSR